MSYDLTRDIPERNHDTLNGLAYVLDEVIVYTRYRKISRCLLKNSSEMEDGNAPEHDDA